MTRIKRSTSFLVLTGLFALSPLSVSAGIGSKAKTFCGSALALAATVSLRPLGEFGKISDVVIQGILNVNGLTHPSHLLRAAKRRLKDQSSVRAIWRLGNFGEEAWLRPRDPQNELSKFIAEQNVKGVEVLWAVLPPKAESLYIYSQRQIYLSNLDLGLLAPSHYAKRAADQAELHRLRMGGEHTGPLFISFYDTQDNQGSVRFKPEAAEILWIYPRLFKNVLSTQYSWAMKRNAMLDLLAKWRVRVAEIAGYLTALTSGLNSTLEIRYSHPAAPLFGEDGLNWILFAVKERPGLKAAIPFRPPSNREVYPPALLWAVERRLASLQDLVKFLTLRIPRLSGLMAKTNPEYEEQARELIEEIVNETDLYLEDTSDPESPL